MNQNRNTKISPARKEAVGMASKNRALERQVKALKQEIDQDRDLSVQLSPKHIEFCELYCFGGKDYIGNPQKCYMKAFDVSNKLTARTSAQNLLTKPYITEKIDELLESTSEERRAMKMRITETLFSIMDETSEGTYIDRFGTVVSPAPLRSVAINAARTLADIHGLKAAQESKLTVGGDTGTGVVFNLIAPTPKNEEH
ncbi:MAG: terminase small subunit [Bacteroidales bacterium]